MRNLLVFLGYEKNIPKHLEEYFNSLFFSTNSIKFIKSVSQATYREYRIYRIDRINVVPLLLIYFKYLFLLEKTEIYSYDFRITCQKALEAAAKNNRLDIIKYIFFQNSQEKNRYIFNFDDIISSAKKNINIVEYLHFKLEQMMMEID